MDVIEIVVLAVIFFMQALNIYLNRLSAKLHNMRDEYLDYQEQRIITLEQDMMNLEHECGLCSSCQKKNCKCLEEE